jgi:hypothetical protein
LEVFLSGYPWRSDKDEDKDVSAMPSWDIGEVSC